MTSVGFASLPSMRLRMAKRERYAHTLSTIPESPSPAASASPTKVGPMASAASPVVSLRRAESTLALQLMMPDPYDQVEDQYPLQQHQSMSSIATSSVSNESLSTDYGLHRALNSVVVPNEQNPIATIKDRKNANYLEGVNEEEVQLRENLDDAIAAYDVAISSRDFNNDPKLEALLNREYYEANLNLTRCSREYTAFQEELNELRAMPKLSRAEMKRMYTNVKAQERLDRIDENDTSIREKLRQTRQQIEQLQFDREEIQKRADNVKNLGEHVAYQAHLLTHSNQRIENLSEHAQYVEHMHGTLLREYAIACGSFSKHLQQVDRLNVDLKERVTACVNENTHLHATLEQRSNEVSDLQTTLNQQSSNCQTLMQYGDQVKRDNAALQRDLDGVRINIDSLQHDNNELQRSNSEMQSELDFSRDFARELSDKLHDAQAEFKTIQNQLSYAKAMYTQQKDEAQRLRINQSDLNQALDDAHVQMQKMQIENDRHARNNEYYQDRIASMRDSNAHLRREFNELLRVNEAADANRQAADTTKKAVNTTAYRVEDIAHVDRLKGWSSV